MPTGSGGHQADWKAMDFINLSAFGFGGTAFSTALGVVVLPVLVLAVVPEEMKNTYLGLLGLAGLGVAMAVQPLAGRMSDRTISPWGRRAPYLVVGSLLTCVAVFVLGVASNFSVLALGLILTQLCLNSALGPYQALVRDLVPQLRRGAGSSFKIMADAGGGVVFLALVAFLLGPYSGPQNARWLWISLAMLSVTLGASAAWTAVAVRHKEAHASGAGAVPSKGSPGQQTRVRFGQYLASRFCVFGALAVFQTYALFFLRDVVGLTNPAQAVGTISLAAGSSLLVAVYPFGRLSDLVGRRWVMVASALGGAGGVVALLLTNDLFPVILISTWLGACAGAFLGTSWAMATDLVSSGRTAEQMGIVNAAAVGGTALAKLAGPGVDLLNRLEGGLGYSTLLVACAVLFVLGVFLLLPLPRKPALGST
ncbi:MAG: MFS transporter [Chloroflexota bacterium]